MGSYPIMPERDHKTVLHPTFLWHTSSHPHPTKTERSRWLGAAQLKPRFHRRNYTPELGTF
uniref:Uncharacterized protein n=1 Tax=Anguilla anguilla TaxID=7936 RepID=A0A0E9U3N4_ANGAN